MPKAARCRQPLEFLEDLLSVLELTFLSRICCYRVPLVVLLTTNLGVELLPTECGKPVKRASKVGRYESGHPMRRPVPQVYLLLLIRGVGCYP